MRTNLRRRASDTKLSNPKDVFGSAKIDLGLAPDTLAVCAARAFLEGALKYGRYNWRIAGVRSSIYRAALNRHVAKWWNGQDHDPKTRVHHLDNAIACLAIIRDAELYGKLRDDRPPCPDPDAMARFIDGAEVDVAFLKAMFAGQDPKQYTIGDTPRDTRRRSEGSGKARAKNSRRVQTHARAKRNGRTRS